MNVRMPAIAAAAVVLASLSLSAVVQGNGWLFGGLGATIVVAAAGMGSRMPGLRFPVTASVVVLIGVVPLLFGPGWAALVTGLAIVAVTALSATGKRSPRGFAVVALYLAALLIYLNLAFAAGHSYGHLLPSHASMDYLGQLVRTAFASFRGSPPVPDTRAVSLVGTAGIGLVAILVDLLAVRMQRPAIAGLPLLVLFSVPVTSNLKSFGGLQVLTFAAGMAGYLTLLSTAGRQRLRMWGQLVTFKYVQPADEAGSGPDTKQLAASGRRVGLVAVCLAVIIPIVLPSVRPHDMFATAATGSGAAADGGGTSSDVNASAQLDPMLQVQQQLKEHKPQPVLTYTTSASGPGDEYLQVYVLNYNQRAGTWQPEVTAGSGFRYADGTKLPYAPQGQLASSQVSTIVTTVTLNKDQTSPDEGGFLPAPYAPVKLAISTPGWAEFPGSLMMYNSGVPLGGQRYTVTSNVPDPTVAQIENSQATTPTSILTQYGGYSGPDNSQLAAIAHQHTAGAATELQAALDLQRWFTSGSFRYSLKPDLPSSHWLLAFLTKDRRGYCQQFAWAFAVLARLVGIPSRIVVGYTGGTATSHNSWQVTTADAHAWPELYFPGEGWLRFEPTPQGPAGQGTAVAPPYASGSAAGGLPSAKSGNTTGATGSAGSPHQPTGPGLNRFQHGQSGGGALKLPTVSGSDLWLVILIPVLVLLLIGLPGVTRKLTRRRRWLAAAGDAAVAGAAWRELIDDLADFGVSRQPGETPRAMARRIRREADLNPAAAAALGRVVTAAERAQYARLAGPASGLPEDVLTVRRALAASVPARRRIRAWLFPTSTLKGAQHQLQRAGDMLTWLDTSVPALRRQLRGTEQRSTS
jgi:transglutaminase-like putative cysteine protease